MKTKLFSLAIAIVAFMAKGQGTFVYDQQSATEGAGAETTFSIQSSEPMGQSFTPTLSSVGFIRLDTGDFNHGNSLGATVYVNLLADSITETILDSSSAVSMPDSFGGYVDFIFSTPASVIPGATYYFQPIVESGGDIWLVGADSYGYSGGSAFINGVASTKDLWFREGIIVSEPSSSWLILCAAYFSPKISSQPNWKHHDFPPCEK